MSKPALRIRELREALGWTQAELADKAGLDITAISKFENDRGLPSCKNLIRLADAFDVTLDRLVGRGDD